MAGVLHALLHTKGDAIVECDNRAVWRIFSKGPTAQPKHNGMLWHCIFRARQQRIDLGYGQLHLLWIKAHVAIDVAVAQGMCPFKRLAHATADILADRAAELVQLSNEQLSRIHDDSE